MADIYHIYPPKLPGYPLSHDLYYSSFEVTIDYHCSILRNNDDTFTFYFTDCSYRFFEKPKYVKKLQIDTVNFKNGQELFCWFCKENLFIDDEIERRIFSALKKFDPKLANEFNQPMDKCKNCNL